MSRRTICGIFFIFTVFVTEFWVIAKHHSRKKVDSKKEENDTQKFRDPMKRQSGIDYLAVTDPGPPESINVKSPGSGLSEATGDGSTDDKPAIQAIFDHAATLPRPTVYFPPGRYRIASDVDIGSANINVQGSSDGMSVIMADTDVLKTVFGHQGSKPLDRIIIGHLFFEGVRLVIGGSTGNKKHHVHITYCVFFSRGTPSATAPDDRDQVFLRHVDNRCPPLTTITHSVFLRNEPGFGVGAKIIECNNIRIAKNIFGLDLSQLNWLSHTAYWSSFFKPRLEFLMTDSRFSLPADQGYFKSSIYDQFTTSSVIKENIFNGSPNFVGNRTYHKDHVVNFKGFRNLNFFQNYARGWPSDTSGGIKARNGQTLVIARNYVDDTGILMYTQDTHGKPDLYLGLKNVLVYGNHMVERTNLGNRISGIAYYEPDFTGNDENLVYSANVFEIVGATKSPPHEKCIFLGNGNLAEHHVYRDNVYEGTTTPVKLDARTSAGVPSYESGSVSSSRVKPYVGLHVPNYTIPVYAPRPTSG